jgi:hypothetical protein
MWNALHFRSAELSMLRTVDLLGISLRTDKVRQYLKEDTGSRLSKFIEFYIIAPRLNVAGISLQRARLEAGDKKDDILKAGLFTVERACRLVKLSGQGCGLQVLALLHKSAILTRLDRCLEAKEACQSLAAINEGGPMYDLESLALAIAQGALRIKAMSPATIVESLSSQVGALE